MQLVSFDGFSFSLPADPFQGDVLWQDLAGQWSVDPSFSRRRNGKAAYKGMTISERTIPALFKWQGDGSGFWDNVHLLLSKLDPYNPEPRLLVAKLDNGTLVQRKAIVSPVGIPDNSVNEFKVTFFSDDPTWYAQSVTTVGPTSVTAATYGGVTAANGGLSRATAHLRLAPSGSTPTQMYTFSITNNGAKTMRKFPVRVDFGNTFDGLAHPTFYFALLYEGKVQRCNLQNFFGRQTYLWMIVEELAAGATANYQLLVSSTYLMPGTAFNSYSQPAFNTDWLVGVLSAIGTTTSLPFSAVSWATNQWAGGSVKMLTGPNAGLERDIISNTSNTLTTAAFPVANASGNQGIITMSKNGKWVNNVKTAERNDSNRGLWWLNRGQSTPSQVRFDVPGGWQRYLYANNDDEKTQARWTAIDPLGGTNYDYFSILNVSRIWKGGAQYSERNSGDGVMLSLPFEITQLKLDYQLANPNRTSAMIVGGRESGSEEFGVKYRDDAVYASLTASAVQTVSIGGGATQVYVGLVNRLGDAIGADWPKDSGTATAATGTTLTDSTKNWTNAHWIGATLRITGGAGIGQSRTVTAQSGSTVTVAAWTTTPDTTSQYTLTLPAASAQLMSNTTWELSWDASNLVVTTPTPSGAVGANAYVMEREVYIGRSLSGDPPPYQRIRMKNDVTGRYIVLASGERLEIDGEQMRAWISDGSGNILRYVPPDALIVEDLAADGTTRLADKWLWLKPGNTPIRLQATAGGVDQAVTETHTSGWDG